MSSAPLSTFCLDLVGVESRDFVFCFLGLCDGLGFAGGIGTFPVVPRLKFTRVSFILFLRFEEFVLAGGGAGPSWILMAGFFADFHDLWLAYIDKEHVIWI